MGKLEYSRVAKEKEIEDWMASEEIDERPTKHPSTQSEQHQASWYQNHVVNHGCCTSLCGLQVWKHQKEHFINQLIIQKQCDWNKDLVDLVEVKLWDRDRRTERETEREIKEKLSHPIYLPHFWRLRHLQTVSCFLLIFP